MTSKTPVSQKRYTLEDIDVMRECIIYIDYSSVTSGWEYKSGSPEKRVGMVTNWYNSDWLTDVEEKLRTYMVGGIDPKELVAKKLLKEEELEKEAADYTEMIDLHYQKIMNKRLRKVFGLDE